MFSALRTTHSLPPTSSTLPLRTELAITLTIDPPPHSWRRKGPARAGTTAARHISWRFLQAFIASAKEQLKPLQRELQQRPWWHPDAHADRRPFLAARGRIKGALRRWFEAEGFAEVETAALQVSPGNETHLHAFATELIGTDGTRRPLYLATSPEFACKKLLAAGEEKIFTFAPAFRNREQGPLHHPAFTMLEWYRAREPYERLMQDCADVLRIAAEAADADRLQFRGRAIDPKLAPERITVAEAFERWAGIDLLATVDEDAGNAVALAAAANRTGIRTEPDDTWSDVFSRVLVARIEPA